MDYMYVEQHAKVILQLVVCSTRNRLAVVGLTRLKFSFRVSIH